MDLIGTLNSRGKVCTGCGACLNVCPARAVSMKEDQEGFLYPQIDPAKCMDCRLCERFCPCLNPKYDNDSTPKCYAMMASDEERATSASGGFAAAVARWIIRQGGVVFGAAWDADWRVRHVAVENENDLVRIKSSKYVQSDTKLTYRQAKAELQKGRWVLYTGMPCQIAGLYASLGDDVSTDTDRLLTIDILCHGTPSYKVFKKYLDENYDVASIRNISFRDKRYGWSSGVTVEYTNTTNYQPHVKDSFYQAFLPCMIQRPACSQCPMSRLPRQGDFTAGDFWGVERFNKAFDDRKGTSVILVNNEKAAQFLEKASLGFKLWEEVPIDYATHINKTIVHPFGCHSGRKHFFSSLDLKPFNQLVQDSLTHHYAIGIVGLWYGINYGSVLTYYALYSLLRDLGYDAVMLPKPNMLWDESFNDPKTIAQKFIWKHCNVFVPCRVQDEYRRFNDLCKDFVVGSDVVWSWEICGHHSDQFFFLDWVESGHRKIAFAASFANGLSGPENYITKSIYNLKRFDSLSCRESFGAENARKLCGREDIVQVMDPVFLCDTDAYLKAMGEVRRKESGAFVFVYLLNRSLSSLKVKVARTAARLFNAEPKLCANPNAIEVIKNRYKNDIGMLPVLSVEEWLYYIKESSFYVGDSYHGLCFCLIFHKNFLIVYGKDPVNYSGARFYSLLQLVGLEDRLIENELEESSIEALIKKPIDWDEVDKRLQSMKDFSLNWLKEALSKQKPAPGAEEYINDNFLRKLSERGVQLFESNQELKNYKLAVENYKQAQAERLAAQEKLLSVQMDALQQTMRRFEALNQEMEFYRKLTWLPRKVVTGLQFWKKHGFCDTLGRFFKRPVGN